MLVRRIRTERISAGRAVAVAVAVVAVVVVAVVVRRVRASWRLTRVCASWRSVLVVVLVSRVLRCVVVLVGRIDAVRVVASLRLGICNLHSGCQNDIQRGVAEGRAWLSS